ncbi:calcium-transporting ATPase 12 [Pyrus ussuriensis x Pyrus communis]|uniref:Calcium-transporting ATPase 12 n=1 Tax=Pyrus ussuriensis x Pyrus communis TaxID=2448454 RepID=A0A5N5F7F9_9ROSA|nr:calcium-transporting ATPase 12 [Pyrus ussuriensis x Pyrus communis]
MFESEPQDEGEVICGPSLVQYDQELTDFHLKTASSSVEITITAAHPNDLEPPPPTITKNHHLRGGKKMDSDFEMITSQKADKENEVVWPPKPE